MTSQYGRKMVQIIAAGLTGAVLGAAGISVLHAQTAPTAPAFFVSNIQEVLDPALFQKYQAEGSKTSARYGARVIAVGPPALIDAPRSTQPKGIIFIMQFPSMKDLQAWWNSPEYSAVRPMREKATVGQIYVIGGLPTP